MNNSDGIQYSPEGWKVIGPNGEGNPVEDNEYWITFDHKGERLVDHANFFWGIWYWDDEEENKVICPILAWMPNVIPAAYEGEAQ